MSQNSFWAVNNYFSPLDYNTHKYQQPFWLCWPGALLRLSMWSS